MNKEIKYLIIEIILVLIILIFGLPNMLSINSERIKTTKAMLENSSSLTIKNNDLDNSTLIMATDEYAKNEMNMSSLTITNTTNKNKEYNIILAISKESTIKLDDLKIIIDNDISLLNDNINYEDNDNYYFNIYSSNVKKESNVEFALYIRDDIDNFSGGTMSYYFIVEENNTLALK